ncbi:unnamed protein product, partial [Adineta steineri]
LNSAPRQKPNSDATISREKRKRSDYLAAVDIIGNGRTFGDFRKSGIVKFLNEAATY